MANKGTRVTTDWLTVSAEQGFRETCYVGNIMCLTGSRKDQTVVFVYLLVIL